MGFFPPVCSNFNNPEVVSRRFLITPFAKKKGPTEPKNPVKPKGFPLSFPSPISTAWEAGRWRHGLGLWGRIRWTEFFWDPWIRSSLGTWFLVVSWKKFMCLDCEDNWKLHENNYTSLLARQKVRDTWFEHVHIIISFYHIQWCCARKNFWSFTPSDIGAEGEERQTAVAGLISWCESSQGESTTKWCLGCDVYWCGSVQCLFCFSPSCLFVCLFWRGLSA